MSAEAIATVTQMMRTLGEFKQTTRKSHRILGFKSLLCSHQMILFEPVM